MRLWEQSEGLWLNHESGTSVLPPPSSGYAFLHESLVGRWASKMNWDCRTGLWACADLNIVGNVMLELLRKYTARLVERNLCWWFHLCTALFTYLFLTGRCSTLKYDFHFFFSCIGVRTVKKKSFNFECLLMPKQTFESQVRMVSK